MLAVTRADKSNQEMKFQSLMSIFPLLTVSISFIIFSAQTVRETLKYSILWLNYFFSHLLSSPATQHDNGNKAILSCSLLAYKPCTYTVEWLYEGEENIYTDMKILPGSCSSAVTFKSQLNQKSKIYESLKCNVTDESSNKVKLFPFSSQSSGEKTSCYYLKVKSIIKKASSVNLFKFKQPFQP